MSVYLLLFVAVISLFTPLGHGFIIRNAGTLQIQLTVTATNKLNIARPNETIELTGQVLARLVHG